MGTNYYAVKNGPSLSGAIHIGKSSAGWLFCFQTQNEKWDDPPVVWNTYEQVRDWLKKHTVDSTDFVIMNEYEEIIPYEQFFGIVDAKQRDPFCRNNPENFFYSRNVNGYRFSDEDFC